MADCKSLIQRALATPVAEQQRHFDGEHHKNDVVDEVSDKYLFWVTNCSASSKAAYVSQRIKPRRISQFLLEHYCVLTAPTPMKYRVVFQIEADMIVEVDGPDDAWFDDVLKLVTEDHL